MHVHLYNNMQEFIQALPLSVLYMSFVHPLIPIDGYCILCHIFTSLSLSLSVSVSVSVSVSPGYS